MKNRIIVAALALLATVFQVAITLGAVYGVHGTDRPAYTVAQQGNDHGRA